MGLAAVIESNPYLTIDAWWGEGLSPSLIARMAASPPEHLDGFRDAAAHVNGVPLPLAAATEVRPALTRSAGDQLRGRGGYRYLNSALLLLLYVDQVAVEDPLPGIDRGDLQSVLTTLLLLKPLHEAGLVKFFQYPHKFYHPSRSHAFMARVNELVETLPDQDPIFAEQDRLTAIERPYGFRPLLFMSASSVGLSLQLAASAPGAANLFAGSAEEAVYMELGIRAVGATAADLRTVRLTALSSLNVPFLRAASIPAVRLNADEFHRWRQAIGIALTRIETISDDDENWQEEARAALQDELAPVRQRLENSVSRSPALTSARSGMAALTYSGVGAVAGASAGGSLGTALAGAAGAKGLEFGVNYLRGLRERRGNRAMLDLAVSFYEPGP